MVVAFEVFFQFTLCDNGATARKNAESVRVKKREMNMGKSYGSCSSYFIFQSKFVHYLFILVLRCWIDVYCQHGTVLHSNVKETNRHRAS